MSVKCLCIETFKMHYHKNNKYTKYKCISYIYINFLLYEEIILRIIFKLRLNFFLFVKIKMRKNMSLNFDICVYVLYYSFLKTTFYKRNEQEKIPTIINFISGDKKKKWFGRLILM